MTLPDYIADYHVHTRSSCDSKSEMAAVCEAAIARGMREIAFTDRATACAPMVEMLTSMYRAVDNGGI